MWRMCPRVVAPRKCSRVGAANRHAPFRILTPTHTHTHTNAHNILTPDASRHSAWRHIPAAPEGCVALRRSAGCICPLLGGGSALMSRTPARSPTKEPRFQLAMVGASLSGIQFISPLFHFVDGPKSCLRCGRPSREGGMGIRCHTPSASYEGPAVAVPAPCHYE